jgi:hypothetical protein
MKPLTSLVLIALLALSSTTVSAHGLATAKTELVGNYLLEFEYDTLGNVQAGQLTEFNFEVLDPNTKEALDFQRAFVKFARPYQSPQGNTIYDTVFNANLFQMSGFGRKSARANIMIPTAGGYEAQVSFYNGTEKLAEHKFTFTVDPEVQKEGEKSSKGFWSFVSVGTFVIGFLGGIAIRKSKKRQEKDNA